MFLFTVVCIHRIWLFQPTAQSDQPRWRIPCLAGEMVLIELFLGVMITVIGICKLRYSTCKARCAYYAGYAVRFNAVEMTLPTLCLFVVVELR